MPNIGQPNTDLLQTDTIAIVGMAGRFPGANDVRQFWQNLRGGVESISHFSEDELTAAGVDPTLLAAPNFVGAYGALDDVESFDAAFFGIPPSEAEIMDPQHRLFLECGWHALEDAGYDSDQYEGSIGVYGGVGVDTYAINNLFSNPDLLGSVSTLQASVRNRTDHVTTQVAYKLNLTGPSVTVQTACSTSLVSVHLACQSLLNGECDMALAGGVSVSVPQTNGYLYTEGSILSPDGHCRAFDAEAQGTVGGSGVGIVVLKRLADAVEDGDTIHAVIRGSAINNDGARKIGYTAPGVDGQANVIAEALSMADVDPATVSYVETHGTGTALGDPIEIEALTNAFSAHTDKTGYCALGAVKSNVGHLDTAAGVTGLIKTVLALKYKELPPSLHYIAPNPRIDFPSTPFYVNNVLRDWDRNGTPRRAGVSSFGIGGTNAHVVLEEWEGLSERRQETGENSRRQSPTADHQSTRSWHLLTISARTSSALESATAQLAGYLSENSDVNLADVAYTLQTGRRAFAHRRMIICRDGSAATALQDLNPQYVFTGVHEPKTRPVVFMFPGQGAQYVEMGAELYQAEPIFRDWVDRCCDLLHPHLGLDLRSLLFPPTSGETPPTEEAKAKERSERLSQTQYTQPALFVIEYALAQLWMSWGIKPEAMIGHSIGEYVAACMAGVFELDDALKLVANRGRMMQELPAGSMLVVTLPEDQVQPYLSDNIALAAVNGQALCVVAGPHEAIDTLEQRLDEQNIGTRRLHTSHAFHSQMMEPILAPFTELVAGIERKPPRMPYISNVTGDWITAKEATDPTYYAQHLRQTVRFADGIHHLVQDPDWILLEVGPGRTLMTIARWHPSRAAGQIVLTSLPHATTDEYSSDVAFVQTTLGRLWLAGAKIDWHGYAGDEKRRRIPLPTYPFERQRFWIDPPKAGRHNNSTDAASMLKHPDMADWFYTPSWKRTPPLNLDAVGLAEQPQRWLLFVGKNANGQNVTDQNNLCAGIANRLIELNQDPICVRMGERYEQQGSNSYVINPAKPEDYVTLFHSLSETSKSGELPNKILHLWNVTEQRASTTGTHDQNGRYINGATNANGATEASGTKQGEANPLEIERVDDELTQSFYSLLYLAQALGTTHGQDDGDELSIVVVTSNMQDVLGGEATRPEQATVIGPCRSMAKEYPNVTCRIVDMDTSVHGAWNPDHLIAEAAANTIDTTPEPVVAYRGRHRWGQAFEATPLPASKEPLSRLRQEGVYLITGGLGGIGLTIAQELAKTCQAKIVLTGRSAFPERAKWDGWLSSHDEDDPTSVKIRKLQELEEMGAEVLVQSADVTNLAQMSAAVAQAEAQFGPISGVIHAAGVAGGGLMQLKSHEQAASVLDPKVKGARVLESIFQNKPLDFWMLCSSRSSILGGFGQADYCAANAFLDAFAHAHSNNRESSQSGLLTVSVNWSGWQEVGMRVNTLAQMGLTAAENGATQNPHPSPDKPNTRDGSARTITREDPHPLLQKVVSETPTRTEYMTTFTVADHWVLDEHRIVKKAVIPGVTYPEMARAALAKEAGDRAIEIRDIFFLSAVGVRDDEARDVRTVVERVTSDADETEFIFSMGVRHGEDSHDSGERVWRDHVMGKAAIVDPGPSVQHNINAMIERCNTRQIIATDEPLTHEDLGPRWQNLKRAYIGENEMVAVLELAEEFDADFEHFKLHCGLLDRTNGAAKIYLAGEGLYMPMGYRRILIKAPLTRKMYAYHIFDLSKDPTRETITFDVILMDEDGVELAVIEAFSQKRVNILAEPIKQIANDKSEAGSGRSVDLGNGSTANSTSRSRSGSTIGRPPTNNGAAASNTAILPLEGAEVFRRILVSQGLSQIVVSPNDLHASIRVANAARSAQIAQELEKIELESTGAGRASHPRPAMTTEYVAPTSSLETEIASIWQTTLGIEQIGINDNFFELGGDSVAGIQMIAKFTKAGYALSPQQLFQHQTIADLAAVLGEGGESSVDEEEVVKDFSLVDLEKDEMAGILAKYG